MPERKECYLRVSPSCEVRMGTIPEGDSWVYVPRGEMPQRICGDCRVIVKQTIARALPA